MATEATQYAKAAEAARLRIFKLVLRHARFFDDVDGLPNIDGFLEAAAEPLRSILTQAWRDLLPESAPLPLVVNILINPNLFFCDRDAMSGQYHKYFRPIYLDPTALDIDRGGSSSDSVLRAAVELHQEFDEHYHKYLEDRTFLSLNDIEALLLAKRILAPLPRTNRVISIWRTDAAAGRASFKILCDTRPYEGAINKALVMSGAHNADERFNLYLEKVTRHTGSYHHITIGRNKNWIARMYLLFRNQEDPTAKSPDWILGLKAFTFDIVAPLALAGTFIRNPGIVSMLGDVHQLLLHSNETGRRHSLTFERFFGSAAQANRKIFPTIDYVLTTELSVLQGGPRHSLHHVRQHLAKCSFWCHRNPHESLTHALEHCSDGIGPAFLADISDLLKGIRAFGDLPLDTVAYLANALTFGLTEDTNRPHNLKSEWEHRSIIESWVKACQSDETLEGQVPKPLRPFIRALVLMTGNQTMVRADASRIGIELEGAEPRLTWHSVDGHFLVTVEYRVSGNLTKEGTKEMDSPSWDALNVNKNALLTHFGRHFLNGFRMCITTTMNDKTLSSIYRWDGDLPLNERTITYGFKFAR